GKRGKDCKPGTLAPVTRWGKRMRTGKQGNVLRPGRETRVEVDRPVAIIAAFRRRRRGMEATLPSSSRPRSMVILLFFITASLAAPLADRSDALALPRLSRGQELVYRGKFMEQTRRGGPVPRSYWLE